MVVRACNTYGPGQFPAKVIPKFIRQMLEGMPATIYNDGKGSRDWLHVDDHARAVETILLRGAPGESYNLGAQEEHTDRDIYERIAQILYSEGLVETLPTPVYVPGRPGHDRRYALNSAKLRALGWSPKVSFAEGFRQTVVWNAHHRTWWDHDLVQVG
jgi:dTDP-glucose 4,6-dehydratase